MVFLYLIALIPLVTGGILFLKCRDFSWQEWLISGSAGFLLAAIFHGSILHSMTADTETWSGEITDAVYYPEWIEEYQQSHTYYTTDSNGNSVSHTYYTTEHRTHERYWEANTSLDTSHRIPEKEFDHIRSKFQNLTTSKPHKSGFDGGDPHIYTSYNKTHYIFPVTDTRVFKNKIKASPSLFSFPEVPECVKTFDYPKNPNWQRSERLVGEAYKKFEITEFDKLNSDLGPSKHVNLIIVGFPDGSSNQDAEWQRAKWLGGKKNDLVICYGGNNNGCAQWCTVFGWTEEELVKRNLETMFVTKPLGNQLFPEIRKEVIMNFQPKEWKKFDYLSVEPPTWVYFVYIFVIAVTEGGILWWALHNDMLGVYGYSRFGRMW